MTFKEKWRVVRRAYKIGNIVSRYLVNSEKIKTNEELLGIHLVVLLEGGLVCVYCGNEEIEIDSRFHTVVRSEGRKFLVTLENEIDSIFQQINREQIQRETEEK